MSSAKGLLAKAGLLNTDAHEYGELASGRNRDLCGTWCMSDYCARNTVTGLQIIHVGIAYKSRCPNCGGTERLFCDRVTRARAPTLKEKAKSFLAFEAQRKERK